MIGLLILLGGALAIGAISGFGDDDDDSAAAEPAPEETEAPEGYNIVAGTQGDDILNTGDDDDFVESGAGDDVVRAGFGEDIVDAGEGDDRVNGQQDSDMLMGGAGDDTLIGEDGFDVILGGDGADEINAGPDDDLVAGDAGNDTLLAGRGDDFVLGGSGDDLIDGFAGDDELFGGADRDTINGGEGDDILVGGDDDPDIDFSDPAQARIDAITAAEDSAEDSLDGGPDNDVIFLGAGDVVTGGAGADDFLIDRGIIPEPENIATRITDFTPGEDAITVLLPQGQTGFTAEDAAALQRIVPDGVLIDFAAEDSQNVLLEGLTELLGAEDFRIYAG